MREVFILLFFLPFISSAQTLKLNVTKEEVNDSQLHDRIVIKILKTDFKPQ